MSCYLFNETQLISPYNCFPTSTVQLSWALNTLKIHKSCTIYCYLNTCFGVVYLQLDPCITFSESNINILFKSNMLASYTLELFSYVGINVSFTQSQKAIILQTVRKISTILTVLQNSIAITEIELATKNIEIIVNLQKEFIKVNTALSTLSNSSNSVANSTVEKRILAIFSNFTSILHLLGKMCNSFT